MQYHFGDCVHPPAGFIIFAELAQLMIIIIINLVFHILRIVRSCKIAQTISDGV